MIATSPSEKSPMDAEEGIEVKDRVGELQAVEGLELLELPDVFWVCIGTRCES